MDEQHRKWIKQNVMGSGYGACAEVTKSMAEAREEIERLRAFFRDVVIEIQPTDAATREGSIPTIGMMVTELACDFPHLAEIVRLHKKPVGRRRERKGDD